MLKNYLFFGYTKASVEEEMDKLMSKIYQLEQDLAYKDEALAKATEELRRAKSEELLIQEAIIDAKALSRKILKEAQEQARMLMTFVEDDVNDKLDKVSQGLDDIKRNKTSMLSQESAARLQLKESLNRYLSIIDENADSFVVQNNILEVDFRNIEDSLKKTKTIITQTARPQEAEEIEVELIDDPILPLKAAEA